MTSKVIASLGIIGGGLFSYYYDETRIISIGALRFGRAAITVLDIAVDYRSSLYKNISKDSANYYDEKSKVGQHLGSLDYLLPYEYVSTLKILHSKAPQAPLNDIYDVIRHELKKEPSDLFNEFDENPLGAASLAQVHKARLKDGRVVAVKVQYPAVSDHSNIDMKGMEVLVKAVSLVFPDFKFNWLVEEMKRNLPQELDFANEGRNAERIANMFAHLPWLKVPSIDWSLSTSRVLTMEYCEGGQVNDIKYMKSHDIDTLDVSRKLGELYAEMIFVNGFVHCDPHPGNVLVNKLQNKTEIILLDHGLYTTLTEKFRLTYARLWQSILNANLKDIEFYGREMGLGDLYGLFTCMVTGRSWDSIIKGIREKKLSPGEEEQIKGDAAKYLPEIAEVLNRVPRQMLLIFKTNDLLRGIEYSLNTNRSMKSFISMSRCCIRAVFDYERKRCSSVWCSFRIIIEENFANFKLNIYTFYLWILNLPLWKKLYLRKLNYDKGNCINCIGL
ncbi:putative aarF domain-containing protein kinase 1 [Armadillidium vulgare]|nr:putative aarF domain-containing protein kinase 1 [Armadillidium vulgare]